MAALLPLLQVPELRRTGAAVSQQPSRPKPAASLLDQLATTISHSVLRLTANQRLDLTRYMVLANVQVRQIWAANQPETVARIYVNNSKLAQLLRFKFERTGGGAPPLGDPLLFLMAEFDDPALWVPAGPKRPLKGWPFDHLDERVILIRPGEKVYAAMNMWGPTGWLHFSLLDSNDPNLVR